jgi:guanine deaminase
MTSLRGKTFLATGFHAPELGKVEHFTDALITLDEVGVIASILDSGDAGYVRAVETAREKGQLERLPANCFLLPGFVDLHIHAPQYPQLGSALDEPLEVWLQKYTFPLEARYVDVEFARRIYRTLVADLLSLGTTTALYFATIHQDATRALADICMELGQRALIGKVAMDERAACPDFYRDVDAAAAIEGTRSLIAYIRAHPENGEGRVLPVVTPRFVPACTDALLEGLGALAGECGCHIQTHCSESDWEHDYVKARHQMTDAMSLDSFGLLGRKTVLAHSNFLTRQDMDLVKARQSAVAHCPVSNAWFAGAAFPLRAALEKGLNIGLGTDISGGYSPSMFENCRAAIMISKVLESGTDPDLSPQKRSLRPASRVGFREAFHIATAGGGHALDLKVGQFAAGYHFDAMLIDPEAASGTIRLFDAPDDPALILEKIVMTASKSNIAAVWVGGDKVSSRA